MCVQSSSSAWSERNVAKRSRARHHTYTVFRGWRPLCTVSSGRASVYCLAAGRGSCVVAVPVRVLVPRHPRSSLVEFSLIIMNVKTRALAFPRTAAPRKRNAQPGERRAPPARRGGPPRRPARGAGSGRCGPRRVQVRAPRLGHVRHGACKGAAGRGKAGACHGPGPRHGLVGVSRQPPRAARASTAAALPARETSRQPPRAARAGRFRVFPPLHSKVRTRRRFRPWPAGLSAGGMPLNKSSTHGWMMTANTCAPPKAKDRRHLETEVKGIMNIESAEYSASEAPWQTTSGSAFRGFDSKTMRNAKLPTTMDPAQPNQTFPDEEEEFQRQTRYQSTHKTQFLDFSVGRGRHQMIKRRTNDPSEADHPTLGRHDDPGRLEKQAAMGPSISTAANAYANPGRESYQPLRCAPRRLLTARVCAGAELAGVTPVSRHPARAGKSIPSGTPRPRGTSRGRCRSSTPSRGPASILIRQGTSGSRVRSISTRN